MVVELEPEEIFPVIREVVAGVQPVNCEDAIRTIARHLGAERLGPRIREVIESALNAASNRSVIYSDGEAFARTIDDYKREDLKNVPRSVVGRT